MDHLETKGTDDACILHKGIRIYFKALYGDYWTYIGHKGLYKLDSSDYKQAVAAEAKNPHHPQSSKSRWYDGMVNNNVLSFELDYNGTVNDDSDLFEPSDDEGEDSMLTTTATFTPLKGFNFNVLLESCQKKELTVEAMGQCHVLSLSCITHECANKLRDKMKNVLSKNLSRYVQMNLTGDMDDKKFNNYIEGYCHHRKKSEWVPRKYWGNEYATSAASIALEKEIFVITEIPEQENSVVVSRYNPYMGKCKEKNEMSCSIEKIEEVITNLKHPSTLILHLKKNHFTPIVARTDSEEGME